jgi:transcriptional regulator with XRE-family HTH domain
MPAMFFGDEHLGKAVAMLRESADLNQKQLAHEVGVEPNTMNQYESGRRGMNEEVIFRIARVLQRDPIEIWDMAYAIFRFNHFRERAEREGVSAEELIARSETRPSEGMILEHFESVMARALSFLAAFLRFQNPAGRAALGGLGLVKIVVKTHPRKAARTRKAVRFSRRERPSPPEPR